MLKKMEDNMVSLHRVIMVSLEKVFQAFSDPVKIPDA